MTDLTIILVTYNSAATLERSLRSLRDHAPCGLSHRIVVVDNASADDSVAIARRIEGVEVVEAGANLGFGAGNNLGMRHAPARFYYLHNTDAYLQEGVLDTVVTTLERRPEMGIIGLPLVYPDLSPQTAAYSFTSPTKWALQGLGLGTLVRWLLRSRFGVLLRGPLGGLAITRSFVATEARSALRAPTGDLSPADWVCGAALVLRDTVRVDTGGFDERIFLYGEDEDLCREARKRGWQVAQIDVTPVIHDFGWGKSGRPSPAVARLKADSLTVLIDKHYRRGSVGWAAMRLMLWAKRRAWGG